VTSVSIKINFDSLSVFGQAADNTVVTIQKQETMLSNIIRWDMCRRIACSLLGYMGPVPSKRGNETTHASISIVKWSFSSFKVRSLGNNKKTQQFDNCSPEHPIQPIPTTKF
jgi:hypothetical protein